ncbi:MAG TPA: hypothetical protein VFT98_13705, partial [Myxococcota bacterium]|nr:hypothetical protein [Myxococcota bacterium]
FRGALDVRARTISGGMTLAAADALTQLARKQGLREDRVLPFASDEETAVRVAVAVGRAACSEGVARVAASADALEREARRTISRVREQLETLVRAGLIATPPERGRRCLDAPRAATTRRVPSRPRSG